MISRIDKRVWQTTFGLGGSPPAVRGNCVQASLATIFSLPLSEVVNPAVHGDDGPAFWAAVDAWLAERDLVALHFEPDNVKWDVEGTLQCLINGKTHRGSNHTVVGEMRREGDHHRFYITHNPPLGNSNGGLVEVDTIVLFVRRFSDDQDNPQG